MKNRILLNTLLSTSFLLTNMQASATGQKAPNIGNSNTMVTNFREEIITVMKERREDIESSTLSASNTQDALNTSALNDSLFGNDSDHDITVQPKPETTHTPKTKITKDLKDIFGDAIESKFLDQNFDEQPKESDLLIMGYPVEEARNFSLDNLPINSDSWTSPDEILRDIKVQIVAYDKKQAEKKSKKEKTSPNQLTNEQKQAVQKLFPNTDTSSKDCPNTTRVISNVPITETKNEEGPLDPSERKPYDDSTGGSTKVSLRLPDILSNDPYESSDQNSPKRGQKSNLEAAEFDIRQNIAELLNGISKTEIVREKKLIQYILAKKELDVNSTDYGSALFSLNNDLDVNLEKIDKNYQNEKDNGSKARYISSLVNDLEVRFNNKFPDQHITPETMNLIRNVVDIYQPSSKPTLTITKEELDTVNELQKLREAERKAQEENARKEKEAAVKAKQDEWDKMTPTGTFVMSGTLDLSSPSTSGTTEFNPHDETDYFANDAEVKPVENASQEIIPIITTTTTTISSRESVNEEISNNTLERNKVNLSEIPDLLDYNSLHFVNPQKKDAIKHKMKKQSKKAKKEKKVIAPDPTSGENVVDSLEKTLTPAETGTTEFDSKDTKDYLADVVVKPVESPSQETKNAIKDIQPQDLNSSLEEANTLPPTDTITSYTLDREGNGATSEVPLPGIMVKVSNTAVDSDKLPIEAKSINKEEQKDTTKHYVPTQEYKELVEIKAVIIDDSKVVATIGQLPDQHVNPEELIPLFADIDHHPVQIDKNPVGVTLPPANPGANPLPPANLGGNPPPLVPGAVAGANLQPPANPAQNAGNPQLANPGANPLPPANLGGNPPPPPPPPQLANPGANLPPAQGNVAATVASEPAKVEGFTEAMTSNISSVSQAVSTTAEALSDNLSEVISSRTNEIFSSQDVAVTGAASGEEGSREVGIWVRGFASQGKQGISKDLPSFKTRHSGGIIGLDTMINDANLLGLAYSHAEIKASINDASNSKTNMKVNVLTAYCSSAFADDIFLNSQFKLGKLRVKNTGASQGKPKGTLWGIREELGYKIRLEDNITVTPTIGIAYDETKLNKYADKDGKKDVVVSSKKYTRLNGILGLNIAKAIDLNGLTFVPNIHGNIEHSFRSKASNLKVSSVNDTADSVILPKNKLGKTSYTLGAGVKLINAGKVEIGMNYDMLKRGKFRSHNGSINLRVNL
jgi:outer membrane autotransporter protein